MFRSSTRTRKQPSKYEPSFGGYDIWSDDDFAPVTTTTKKRGLFSTKFNFLVQKPQVILPKKIIHNFDPQLVLNLSETNPDQYWKYDYKQDVIEPILEPTIFNINNLNVGHGIIEYVNNENQLKLLKQFEINESGPVTGMVLSNDSLMLATFSNTGSAKIWDVETGVLLVSLRDETEPNIDEFFVGRFVNGDSLLFVAGKLKDRNCWSEVDDDNHILPCPVKIFDLATKKVIGKLENHKEEILSIKQVMFNGEGYLVTTGQDGHIYKWKMAQDWTTLESSTRMADDISCMVFNVSFLPNTGNKYFLASTDDCIRLYDFESSNLIQTFDGIFSVYCDCVKFVDLIDFPQPDQNQTFAYILSRGVEDLDDEDNTINSKPNTIGLHKLIYPKTNNEEFQLIELKRYQHEEYRANSWLMKVTSTGRYVCAGSFEGKTLFFNLKTGDVTAILKNHEDVEVRDFIFHPTRKLFYSCADDGKVNVYYQEDLIEEEEDMIVEENLIEKKDNSESVKESLTNEKTFFCKICEPIKRWKNSNGVKYHANAAHPDIRMDDVKGEDKKK